MPGKSTGMRIVVGMDTVFLVGTEAARVMKLIRSLFGNCSTNWPDVILKLCDKTFLSPRQQLLSYNNNDIKNVGAYPLNESNIAPTTDVTTTNITASMVCITMQKLQSFFSASHFPHCRLC